MNTAGSRRDRRGLVGFVLVLACLLTACATTSSDPDRLHVYATTGYLADVVRTLDPDAEVTTMVGPGGDPHTYQPSTRDIQRIEDADAVIWNGLHLEAQMGDLLSSLGDRQVAVGSQIPEELLRPLPSSSAGGATLHDPHIWNDPALWERVVGIVADHLSRINPGRSADYHARADAYIAQIGAVDRSVRRQFDSIPADTRVLVTGHDAFGYLAAAYDFEVHATDFISTSAAISPAQLSSLASLIADRRLPAIFADNQANPQAVTSLREAVQARGWDVRLAPEELYADSLGADPGVDTYLGVLEHNARAITAALGGTTEASPDAGEPIAQDGPR